MVMILIKILERQRAQTQEGQEELSEGRILVPIQEIGDGERQEERIIQGYEVKITKSPRGQDELQDTANERLLLFLLYL